MSGRCKLVALAQHQGRVKHGLRACDLSDLHGAHADRRGTVLLVEPAQPHVALEKEVIRGTQVRKRANTWAQQPPHNRTDARDVSEEAGCKRYRFWKQSCTRCWPSQWWRQAGKNSRAGRPSRSRGSQWPRKSSSNASSAAASASRRHVPNEATWFGARQCAYVPVRAAHKTYHQ